MADATDDCAGGFLVEDDEQTGPQPLINEEMPQSSQKPNEFLDAYPRCTQCHERFPGSFLFDTFALNICNSCRDPEKHDLITKTDAKEEFLLKDCDLDTREPPLSFYRKKNPHNPRADMKLFLRLQVEQRALEVHGGVTTLEKLRSKKEANRDKLRQKRFEKKVKNLRMSVRSNLYAKEAASHVHEYGDEQMDADTQEYFKICSSCGHRLTYEKM